MSNKVVLVVGYVASVFSAVWLVPQVVAAYRGGQAMSSTSLCTGLS